MVRLRMVNRLMAQMANRAVGIGAGMMMRDAAEHHHKHQQREQRYWNGKIPNWTAFMHVTKAGRTPGDYHIRRWLPDANGLRQEHQGWEDCALNRPETGTRRLLQR